MTEDLLRRLQSLRLSDAKMRQVLDALQDQASVTRERIRRGGLRAFTQIFWSVNEPRRPYVHNWTADAIFDHLQAVTDGHVTRLLVNVPPGFMKSMGVQVLWPSYEWGPCGKPEMRYVAASYSPILTIRDNRRMRKIITSALYQACWPLRLMDDQNAKTRFENNHTGWRIATSVDGIGAGERGDRFSVDDPHNTKKAESEADRESKLTWMNETVPTRVNDPELSAIIVIMQRLHSRDISGDIVARDLGYEHLMIPMEYEPERACYTHVKPTWRRTKMVEARHSPDLGRWFVVNEDLPEGLDPSSVTRLMEQPVERVYPQDPRTSEGELAFPERFPRRVVDRDKKAMGSYAVAGQFQQRPAPRGGGLFQRAWFRLIERAPQGASRTVRGWDLAGSETKRSPFTSSVKMSDYPDGMILISDATRLRGTPLDTEREVKNYARSDGLGVRIDIPQDPGQAGKAQRYAYAKMLGGYDVRFSPETGSKVDRATPLSAQAEAGCVYLLAGSWNGMFLDELSQFPNGDYADLTDAASRAYAALLAAPAPESAAATPMLLGVT